MIMRTEALEGCTVEGFLMIRMGDAYEKLGALLKGFSVEVYSSIFSNYIMNMRSCRHDSTAFDDYRSNLAAAFVCA